MPSEIQTASLLAISPKPSQSIDYFPYNSWFQPFHQIQKLCQFQGLIDRVLSRQIQIFSLVRVFIGIVRLK